MAWTSHFYWLVSISVYCYLDKFSTDNTTMWTAGWNSIDYRKQWLRMSGKNTYYHWKEFFTDTDWYPRNAAGEINFR